MQTRLEVVIEFSGGQGLWAAERLGADSIRASRPGYIGEIPITQRPPRFSLLYPTSSPSTVEAGMVPVT